MNLFSLDGAFIKSYGFKDQSLTYNSFCIDNEGFLYFNSVLDTLPFVKYDRMMKRVSAFGEWLMPNDELSKKAMNNFMIANFQNKILCIQREFPRLDLYNTDGTLSISKELDSDLFQSRIKFRENEHNKDPNNKRKVYNLFSSVSIYGNKIYLLYIDHYAKDGRVNCNKIVELTYSGDDFTITNVYQLENDWYISICHTGGNMICFSGSATEFHIYDL